MNRGLLDLARKEFLVLGMASARAFRYVAQVFQTIDQLIYRVFPHVFLEIMRKYFRLKVEGLENIPRRGPALIAPNHSGYLGFDSFLLAHEIQKGCGRLPRILTHHLWFRSRTTATPMQKAGFVEATMASGLEQLNKNNLLIVFPEGESGNFKPSVKRYHLQPFKSGFIRMALLRQCPIVPTLVIGAEETHINLTRINLPKRLRGLMLPLPLNVIPLPAKWKIVFLSPITLPYKASAADDRELVREIAGELREEMQRALSNEIARRGSIFF